MRQESHVDRPRAGQAARRIVLIVGGITLITVLAIVAALYWSARMNGR